MEPPIRYTKTGDGMDIAYCVLGTNDWLVYASNTAGDLSWYVEDEGTRRGVDSLVSSGWRVVRYDGRGMGQSDRRAQQLSLAHRLLDLEAVVDSAGAERFVLCGYGQGGPTAIAYTLRHPDRVSHLVLVNTFADGAAYFSQNPSMRLLLSLSSMAATDWEFLSHTVISSWMHHADPDRARETAAMIRRSMSAATFVGWFTAASEFDLTGELAELRARTLVIEDSSGMVTGEVNRALASGIPDAVFVRTDDYAAALESFVRDEPAGLASQAPNSSFRTILFTDVVSSTPLLTQLRDARMREVMRDHDAVMEAAVTGHGGRVIKTIGDAFMAEFAVPSAAVEAAIEAQRTIRDKFADSDVPVRIRIGINAGEPIEEDGDLHGASVVIAKRLESPPTPTASSSATSSSRWSPAKTSTSRTAARSSSRDSTSRCVPGRCAGSEQFALTKGCAI